MSTRELDDLIRLLARLPGVGARSARRMALAMLKRRDDVMRPLAGAMVKAADTVKSCSICGNLDSVDPCAICSDASRDGRLLCVVEEVEDLWALERAAVFRGRYHVLGGTLSALDGIGPEELRIEQLAARADKDSVGEIIIATSATADGQTTAHYLAERLAAQGRTISLLGHGMPIGGELNYLDDGTLGAALKARRPVL
ncbi:MAG: recombination mediator RecR [Geminicoccaceae bacterium]